jgi:UrcA family protein
MNTIPTCTNLRGLIAAAIFSALASSFTAVAAAADSTDVRRIVVKYADLNLSNSQGAAVLYGRIRRAADSVCSLSTGSDYEATNTGVSACIHKAIADAVTAVNQPALFAVYNTKNRSPSPPRSVDTNHARSAHRQSYLPGVAVDDRDQR